MKKINVGVIGAGLIGKLHIENISRMANIQLKTISDIFVDKVKNWTQEIGLNVELTKDYEDILSNTEIDAILICSPPETHAEIITAAAKKGKHIFCEKPISLKQEETVSVMKVVKESGVKLQVGFNRRFDHNFSRVRELILEDKIGEPHVIKITSRDPHPPAKYTVLPGVIFLETTIHDFDMARFLSGSEVEEVYATGSVLIDPRFGEYGDLDTAVTTLKFKNGALGIIDNSRKADYGYDQRVEVFGSKGAITVDNDYPNNAVISTGEGVSKDKPKYFIFDRYLNSYKKEIEIFVDSIINNKNVPVNGNDGFQAELIAHAARKSYAENRPVKIEEILQTNAD